jgi:hypothetical protein
VTNYSRVVRLCHRSRGDRMPRVGFPCREASVMTATIRPKVDTEATREEITEALRLLSADAGRELRADGLGRPNPAWAVMHEDMNSLLDALVGK